MRKCPDDHVDLIVTDRQGIEVDYCPRCRGVWLDRGELDKIVERSGGSARAEQARLEGQPSEAGYPGSLKITELFDF
ncbi:MAG: zf-TFIIB domain-containing protein [Dongiaceae bacterium]